MSERKEDRYNEIYGELVFNIYDDESLYDAGDDNDICTKAPQSQWSDSERCTQCCGFCFTPTERSLDINITPKENIISMDFEKHITNCG